MDHHFEVVSYLVFKGAPTTKISQDARDYISRCRADAANKIGNWWIPHCYDESRPSGKRIKQRVEDEYRSMMPGMVVAASELQKVREKYGLDKND